MTTDKEITLSEFVKIEEGLLKEFFNYWSSASSDTHPAKLEITDWVDQYFAFLEEIRGD